MRAELLVLLLGACGARTALTETHDSADELPVLDAGGAAPSPVPKPVPTPLLPDPICVGADGPAPRGDCSATLVVDSYDLSSSTCYVDSPVVSGAVGRLTYDCKGGRAEIRFGALVFGGTFDGTSFDTCTGTSFDFSDGCHWNSAQRVGGRIEGSNLQYAYVERPAAGETHCASPCSATARLRVAP